jgi:hypothetical protein
MGQGPEQIEQRRLGKICVSFLFPADGETHHDAGVTQIKRTYGQLRRATQAPAVKISPHEVISDIVKDGVTFVFSHLERQRNFPRLQTLCAPDEACHVENLATLKNSIF